MKTTVVNGEAKISAKATLEYASVGHGLVVFRLTRSDALEPGHTPSMKAHFQSEHSVRQGFATEKALKKYLEGKDILEKSEDVFLSPPNFVKHIATIGFIDAYDECTKESGLESWNDFKEEPYTDIIEKGASLDRVIRIDGGSHMAFKLDGTVLPVALFFEYTMARFNNGAYDLPLARDVLKKNPRVKFVDVRGNRKTYVDEPEILDVPYYNKSTWNSRFLMFVYEPTEEEAKALWAKQLSYKTKYPSTEAYRAMFDLDILGLRAAGAAHYDTFDKNRAYDDNYK